MTIIEEHVEEHVHTTTGENTITTTSTENSTLVTADDLRRVTDHRDDLLVRVTQLALELESASRRTLNAENALALHRHDLRVRFDEQQARIADLASEVEGNTHTLSEARIRADEATSLAHTRGLERDDLQRQLEERGGGAVRVQGTEHAELSQQYDAVQARYVQVLAERDSLENRLTHQNRAFEAFKERVVDVADRYARDNGWCGTVDSALDDLGLARNPDKYTSTVAISVTFTAELRERRELPTEAWVRSSMQTDAIARAIRSSFGMDSDHRGTTIDDIEFEVTNVDTVDED